MDERVELEFAYEPADFFEEPLTRKMEHGILTAANGRAVYAIHGDFGGKLPDEIEAAAKSETIAIFNLRQVRTRSRHKLTGPDVVKYSPGGTERIIKVHLRDALNLAARMDFVSIDEEGHVTRDSRRERIAADEAFIASFLPKMGNSILRAMVESCAAAAKDPDDELVHLYEVLDIVRKHYGGEQKARKALGFTKAWWNRLSERANSAPVRQGRHRGSHVGALRDATDEELAEARSVAHQIIERFAATI